MRRGEAMDRILRDEPFERRSEGRTFAGSVPSADGDSQTWMDPDSHPLGGAPKEVARGWRAFFPPAQWLSTYEKRWLASDLVAGVTLAAYALPVAVAYAGLAGLPPQVGIYGYLLGGIGYALFGSSRHLAIGPTSAISLMVAGRVTEMAGGDAVRYGQIAALAGLTVAILCLIGWLLKLSTLTSFISETILLGFKAGAGLTIASTQLPALLGVPGGGDDFFERVWNVGSALGHLHPLTTLVGLSAVALLVAGQKLLPGRPVALIVVVLSIVAVYWTALNERGVVTSGAVAGGLPSIGLPGLRLRDVDGVIPLAFGCLLLGYIEGVSAARTFAEKHGYAIDTRQELLALGVANLAVGFGGGYPVAGGLSQSAVNEKAGAKSPLALVVASLALVLCVLFLMGTFAYLPKAVLSAVVLTAVAGLIKIPELVRLRHISKAEFRVAVVALVAVLLLGILKGVLLAALASILVLLGRAARPHVAFLGRIPGTRRFSDNGRHPDNEPIPGTLIFRVESSLFYFNVDHVIQSVLARVNEARSPLRLVVLDLSTSPAIDLSGARMLERLNTELAKRGTVLRVVEARSSVRDLMRAVGLEDKVGHIGRFASVADVLDEFHGAAG
jgi:sulfate permease, SulP family